MGSYSQNFNNEKTDRLIYLMNKNDYTNNEIDEFFDEISIIPDPNDSPDYHGDLRNSYVDLSIIEVLYPYFYKYTPCLKEKDTENIIQKSFSNYSSKCLFWTVACIYII